MTKPDKLFLVIDKMINPDHEKQEIERINSEMKELKWFIKRIGKRIYRDKNSCPCHTCTRNWKEGLIVHDEQHADYLCESQWDDILQKDLNYRDKK